MSSLLIVTLLLTVFGMIGHSSEVEIDFGQITGKFRALHGGNNGPLNYGELVDLTHYYKEIGIPLVRVHDSAWPYPDIVDIHAIFPDPKADPSRPENYRFGPTDDYLRAITNAGAQIVFRLGESIEHAKRKRYVHPPQDPQRWAEICVGIVRHYQEGWAEGHHWNIPYWEIWNEPENQPAMWTGSSEAYFQLYSITAKTLRARWPSIKIGGPSLGYQGTYEKEELKASPFLRGFLAELKRTQAPLDFFSWHTYTNDPTEFARRARAVRQFLDAEGYTKTESHLNEWNYLPSNDWAPMTAAQGEAREAWYARQGGMEGAVFLVSALVSLQDSPLDAACYYSTDSQPFGLFSLHGAPKKTFYAMKAFRSLLDTPLRVRASGSLPDGLFLAAGISENKKQGTILISDSGRVNESTTLRILNKVASQLRIVSRSKLDTHSTLTPLPEPSSTKTAPSIQIHHNEPTILLLQLEITE